MSGLVNYSSGDEQDDYQYTKAEQRRPNVKHRRRSKGSSSSDSSGSESDNAMQPPPRKEKYSGGGGSKNERSKNSSTNTNYNNDEDKLKLDKRSDKYREQRRDKRDVRDTNKHSKDNRSSHRDNKDDSKEYDNGHWHDIKKYDDNKRHSKDYKREGNKRDSGTGDYYRDEKRSRYEDKKSYSSSSYNKERFNSSKHRYDERKSYEDKNDERRDDRRSNDDRRNSSGNNRRDYEDRRDRHSNNDDRRTQRSYNQDRSSSYRASNKFNSDRRVEDDRKPHHSRLDSPDKPNDLNISHKEYSVEASSSRPDESKTSSSPDVVTAEKKILPSARNFEALLSLPLNETALKQTNVVTVPPIATSQDDDAVATTVQLPSYYNPKVINPSKYAQQMQKRKLIWGAKKTEDAASKWGHAQFSQDSDGKVASKFMRLMGIKSSTTDSNTNDGEKKSESATSSSASKNPDFKSREAMFSSMEQQYEVARQVTHTMRGVGLGFSSQNRPF